MAIGVVWLVESIDKQGAQGGAMFGRSRPTDSMACPGSDTGHRRLRRARSGPPSSPQDQTFWYQPVALALPVAMGVVWLVESIDNVPKGAMFGRSRHGLTVPEVADTFPTQPTASGFSPRLAGCAFVMVVDSVEEVGLITRF